MKNVLERLLNLLAFLLTVGRSVSAEEIRQTVAGYDREADEAFRRMFERDKVLLRKMGIPLETVAATSTRTSSETNSPMVALSTSSTSTMSALSVRPVSRTAPPHTVADKFVAGWPAADSQAR